MTTTLHEQLLTFESENYISLDILVKLFEMTRKIGNKPAEPVDFDMLAKEMGKEGMSIESFSSEIDRLFDFGMVSGAWSNIDGLMTRTLSVAGEAEWIAKMAHLIL